MPYYVYRCNACGHEGTRYHNVTACPKCGEQWERKDGRLLLESYPNIMPDLMGAAVREALREIETLRKLVEGGGG